MDVCHLFYDVLDLAEAKNNQKNSLSNVNVHSNLYKHRKVCSAACNKKSTDYMIIECLIMNLMKKFLLK